MNVNKEIKKALRKAGVSVGDILTQGKVYYLIQNYNNCLLSSITANKSRNQTETLLNSIRAFFQDESLFNKKPVTHKFNNFDSKIRYEYEVINNI